MSIFYQLLIASPVAGLAIDFYIKAEFLLPIPLQAIMMKKIICSYRLKLLAIVKKRCIVINYSYLKLLLQNLSYNICILAKTKYKGVIKS